MKRILVQFLLILALLFGAYSLLKKKLHAPWVVAFNPEPITDFDRLMVSGMGEEFSIIEIDGAYWLELNGLSYPVDSLAVQRYLSPLQELRSGNRIKKKHFDLLESRGYTFDFTPDNKRLKDFGVYQLKGNYYYQSSISKDYFQIDSFQSDTILDFSYKNLLPKAVNWSGEGVEGLKIRPIFYNDTLDLFVADSITLSVFEGLSRVLATDTIILADWNGNIEFLDSMNVVYTRYNVALDTTTNEIFLEQIKPFNSRTKLDSVESSVLLRLFGL